MFEVEANIFYIFWLSKRRANAYALFYLIDSNLHLWSFHAPELYPSETLFVQESLPRKGTGPHINITRTITQVEYKYSIYPLKGE